jgi:hypothetical protein
LGKQFDALSQSIPVRFVDVALRRSQQPTGDAPYAMLEHRPVVDRHQCVTDVNPEIGGDANQVGVDGSVMPTRPRSHLSHRHDHKEFTQAPRLKLHHAFRTEIKRTRSGSRCRRPAS